MKLGTVKRKGNGDSDGCGCLIGVAVIAAIIYAVAGGGGGGGGGGGKNAGGGGEPVNAIDRAANWVRDIPTRVEPPVQVSLQPFTFTNGFYVTVMNTSSDKHLKDVTVVYVGASGNTKEQRVGELKPGQAVRLDPDDIRWRVEKNEKIRVSADGYLTKTLETNQLIK